MVTTITVTKTGFDAPKFRIREEVTNSIYNQKDLKVLP
jgi:hypothetical protein